MAKCNKCGATLPDEARFCLQCGSAVEPPDAAVPRQTPGPPAPELDFIRPALAGGVFLGLLSSLPLVSIGCCIWVPSGGSFAAFLLTKQRQLALINYGDGAFAGVLSGLFGSIVATFVSIPIKLVSARYLGSQQDAIEKALRDLPAIEEPMRSLLLRLLSPEISAVTLLFTFVSNLIIYALFAMVGAILTLAILKKQAR